MLIQLVGMVSQPVAVLRQVAPAASLSRVVPEACGRVWQWLRQRQAAGVGRNLAIYWDDAIRLDVGVEWAAAVEGAVDGDVVASATPSGIVARATHRGPYPQLADAHAALLRWCAEHRLRRLGPRWEIYGHWQPQWNDHPSQILTEIHHLVAPERPAEAAALEPACADADLGPRIAALKAQAQTLRGAGQVEAALSHCEQAVLQARAYADPLLLAHSVRHAGDLGREAGRLDEAQRSYAEALVIYDSTPAPALDHANAQRGAALLAELRGQGRDAARHWTHARALYLAAGVRAGELECDEHLHRLASAEGGA
jgi:effector-binding domain-containing protein